MDEFWAQFWASVFGALTGGLLAALVAWRVFVAERRASDDARSRDAADAQVAREANALEAIHDVLAALVVNRADDAHAVPTIRQLKNLALRAQLVFRSAHPGLVTWLGGLHWAASVRLAALGLQENQDDLAGDDPLIARNLAFNSWITTVDGQLVSWQLGEADDEQMKVWSESFI